MNPVERQSRLPGTPRDPYRNLSRSATLIGVFSYAVILMIIAGILLDPPACFPGSCSLPGYYAACFFLLVLLFAAADLTWSLPWRYYRWQNGKYGRFEEERSEDISLLSPEQTCRIIIVAAWLACIVSASIIIAGYSGTARIITLPVLVLLAGIQTIYAGMMRRVHGSGQVSPAP